MQMRSRGLAALLLGAASLLSALPSTAQPVSTAPGVDEFRVTLLGTGSPAPVMRRFGPGVLVQAGGRTLLIDSGRGVTQRLFQLGVPLGKVDALFLTHLHSDHVVGIPDLEWGEVIGAGLVPEGEGIDLVGLGEWLKTRLPSYKVPRHYLLLEELPRNVLGKVTKNALKELFTNTPHQP